MKLLITFSLIFGLIINAHSQQFNSKTVAINNYLAAAKIESSTRFLVKTLINRAIIGKKNLPQNIEDRIQSKLEYKAYLDKVAKIMNDNYSEAEIDQLTKLLKEGNNKEVEYRTKRVYQQIYQIGLEFGRESKIIIDKTIAFYN